LGVVQKNENEEEMLDVQKKEVSVGSKIQRHIEREGVATEGIEVTAKHLRRGQKNGQNWIWMG
jgi:hypothetical protein